MVLVADAHVAVLVGMGYIVGYLYIGHGTVVEGRTGIRLADSGGMPEYGIVNGSSSVV